MSRGFRSFRANWELIGMLWLMNLVVSLLTVAGLVMPLAAVELGDLGDLLGGDEQSWARLFADLYAELTTLSPGLIGGLVGLLVVWTLAFVIACWFQGGFYGVLMAADRQAPEGVRDRRLFRAFSLREYGGWGGRLLWRYFWLFNLLFLVLTVVAILGLGMMGLAIYGGERWGSPAAIGIGCGGALPVLLMAVATSLVFLLAAADLARPESGVSASVRRGLGILGSRLGAVLLFVLVYFALAMAASTPFFLVDFAMELGLRDQPAIYWTSWSVMQMVQWLISGALITWLAATVIALVTGESRRAEAL